MSRFASRFTFIELLPFDYFRSTNFTIFISVQTVLICDYTHQRLSTGILSNTKSIVSATITLLLLCWFLVLSLVFRLVFVCMKNYTSTLLISGHKVLFSPTFYASEYVNLHILVGLLSCSSFLLPGVY